MSHRLRHVIYSLGIVGVMILSSNVYSQPSGDHLARHDETRANMKARMLEIFKQLDLSPEQEKLLQAHRNNHREQAGEFLNNLKIKKEEIRNELQKEDLNMEKVYKIHNELKHLLSKKADHRLEGILEVRKILTTEQFRKFCKLRKNVHPWKQRRKEFN